MRKLLFLFILCFSFSFAQGDCEDCVVQGGFYCGDDDSNWTQYSPNGCVQAGWINDGWLDCVDRVSEVRQGPAPLLFVAAPAGHEQNQHKEKNYLSASLSLDVFSFAEPDKRGLVLRGTNNGVSMAGPTDRLGRHIMRRHTDIPVNEHVEVCFDKCCVLPTPTQSPHD